MMLPASRGVIAVPVPYNSLDLVYLYDWARVGATSEIELDYRTSVRTVIALFLGATIIHYY